MFVKLLSQIATFYHCNWPSSGNYGRNIKSPFWAWSLPALSISEVRHCLFHYPHLFVFVPPCTLLVERQAAPELPALGLPATLQLRSFLVCHSSRAARSLELQHSTKPQPPQQHSTKLQLSMEYKAAAIPGIRNHPGKQCEATAQ